MIELHRKTVPAGAAQSTRATSPKASATAEGGRSKGQLYRPLAKQFRRDGFDYRQIAREGNVAIYEQIWRGNEDSAAFEVLRIKRRDGFEVAGRVIEPSETYPPATAWGTDGFTLTDKDAAFAKLQELLGKGSG